jgi:hypothetical protein
MCENIANGKKIHNLQQLQGRISSAVVTVTLAMLYYESIWVGGTASPLLISALD